MLTAQLYRARSKSGSNEAAAIVVRVPQSAPVGQPSVLSVPGGITFLRQLFADDCAGAAAADLMAVRLGLVPATMAAAEAAAVDAAEVPGELAPYYRSCFGMLAADVEAVAGQVAVSPLVQTVGLGADSGGIVRVQAATAASEQSSSSIVALGAGRTWRQWQWLW